MQTVIEKLEGLKRRLSITVPEEDLTRAYREKLKKLVKTARIDGFRPGKVPQHVVENRYGQQLLHEAAGDLMESSFREAVTEHELNLAGQPQVTPEDIKKDQSLTYTAIFDVYPDIELRGFDGTDMEKIEVEVTAEDEADAIERLQRKHAVWNEVDRQAKLGDQVVIDYEGSIDGNLFDGGTSTEFTLELGSNQMIPGFEEGLLGVKAGEERNIEVSFPESYPVKDLAGKAAVFLIKVHRVLVAELPSLDDDFAKTLGFDKGFESFKGELGNLLKAEGDRLLSDQFRSQIFDKLLELNPIELPESMIAEEINHLQGMERQQMAMREGKKELPDVDLPREPYVEDAKRRVTLGLLLAEVIKSHELKVEQDKVRQRIVEMVASYPNPEEIAELYFKNEKLRSEVEAQVLEQQAVDKLLEKVNIISKTESYGSVMAKNSG